MTINWGELMDQSGGAFEPLPKGAYDVVVHSAEDTKSSTDKTMFKVVFKVVGGPHNGRNLYHNIVLTVDNPMALRMFFLNMKAFGLEKEFFAQNPVPSQVAAAMIGRELVVNLDHRMYQGQMRENVKSLAPKQGILGGGSIGVAPTITGAQVGPSIVPGGSSIPTPGASPSVVPSMPVAPPVVSQPAPSPTPAPAPTPAPIQESTIPIPPPINPVPPEPKNLVSEPGNGGNDVPPVPGLPPGMTPEMFEQFKAFQAAQAAAAAATATVVPAQTETPVAPPAEVQTEVPAVASAPAGAPPFPLGEAF